MKTNYSNMKQLPASFFLFVGDNYCDSENWNSRYGKADDGAEYGMSWDEFVNTRYEDAVLDGEDAFEKLDPSSKISCLQSFVDSCRRAIENKLKDANQVEKFLFSNAPRSDSFGDADGYNNLNKGE